jgi:hypothetical protein
MTSKLDVLAGLWPLTWRGIEVPCQQNSAAFRHEQVAHKQHGVSGAHIEWVCRDAAKFDFNIPFRAGITQYQDLYPTRFKSFWAACLDGSADDFGHPALGILKAKCDSFELTFDPQKRDGYDAHVVWSETTEDTSLESAQAPIDSAIAVAAVVETNPEMPEYDDGSGLGLLDSIKSIKGQMQLMEMSFQDAISRIDNVIAALNGIIDTCSKVTSVLAVDLQTWLKRMVAFLQETETKLAGKQKTNVLMGTTTAVTIVADIASSCGMTIDAFLKMNPRLGASKTAASGLDYFFVK